MSDYYKYDAECIKLKAEIDKLNVVLEKNLHPQTISSVKGKLRKIETLLETAEAMKHEEAIKTMFVQPPKSPTVPLDRIVSDSWGKQNDDLKRLNDNMDKLTNLAKRNKNTNKRPSTKRWYTKTIITAIAVTLVLFMLIGMIIMGENVDTEPVLCNDCSTNSNEIERGNTWP